MALPKSRIVRGVCIECGNTANECECDAQPTESHTPKATIEACGYCGSTRKLEANEDGWLACPDCGCI